MTPIKEYRYVVEVQFDADKDRLAITKVEGIRSEKTVSINRPRAFDHSARVTTAGWDMAAGTEADAVDQYVIKQQRQVETARNRLQRAEEALIQALRFRNDWYNTENPK